MNAQNLAEFIKNPDSLDKKSYAELKSMLDQYPYFQTAHLLILRNAKNVKIVSIDKIAAKSSAFINDRTKIFELLHDSAVKKVAETPNKHSVREQEPSRVRTRDAAVKTTAESEVKTEPIVDNTTTQVIENKTVETTSVIVSEIVTQVVTEVENIETKSESAIEITETKPENSVTEIESAEAIQKTEVQEIIITETTTVSEITETKTELVAEVKLSEKENISETAEDEDKTKKKHESLVNEIIRPKIETELQYHPKDTENSTSDTVITEEESALVLEEQIIDKQALTDDIFRKIANIERSTSASKNTSETVVKEKRDRDRKPATTEHRNTFSTETEIKSEDLQVADNQVKTEVAETITTPETDRTQTTETVSEKIEIETQEIVNETVTITESVEVKETEKTVETIENKQITAETTTVTVTETVVETTTEVSTTVIENQINTDNSEAVLQEIHEDIITEIPEVVSEIASETSETEIITESHPQTISPEQLLNEVSTTIHVKEDVKPEISETEEKKQTAADALMARIAAMRNQKPESKDLITKFIQNEPKLDVKKELVIDGDISEESVREKDPIVTELMASIYINQGLYDKAIDVFKKLILKYPEKKDYFAAKIQDTQELKN